MKKILSLMLAFACALFVGVSCTPDNPGDGNGGGDVDTEGVVALTFDEFDTFAPSKGTYTLPYTVNVKWNISSQIVLGKPSAEWLKVKLSDDGDDYLVVTLESNPSNPGSAPRSASFTATLDNYDPVTVTVKQNSHKSVFEIEWLSKSCNEVTCYCVPEDDNLKYMVVSSSQLADLGVTGDTVADQLKDYAEKMGKEGALDKPNEGYWFQGSSQKFPTLAVRGDATQGGYIYAVGFEAEPNGETETDEDGVTYNLYTASLLTAVHTWEVEFAPYPTFEIPAENQTHKVSSEAGTKDIDCIVTNPMTDGVYEVSAAAGWVTPSWEDGKLKLSYEENTSAIGRSTTVTVKYGQNKVYNAGTENERTVLNIYTETTFNISQERNPNAAAPTYEITWKQTQFHKFVVDVTTSDENVEYVVDATLATNITEKRTLAQMAQNRVEDARKYGGKVESYKLKTQKGNLVDYCVKLSVNNYENNVNKDYLVYVYPVDTESMTVLADPTFIELTADNTNKPTLKWVKSDNMVWNENRGKYEIYANPGETVTLKYELTNPVAEGVVDVLNRAYISNMYIIVDNNIVIDQENCTVTLTVREDYDACTKHSFDFGLTYKDKDDPNWIWGVQSDSEVEIYQNEPTM